MTVQRKRSRRLLAAASILFALQISALAASDDPYKQVVEHIQKSYHGKKVSIPFVGVANFVLKFWHPAGVKNVKLTVFEEHSLFPEAGSKDFDGVVTEATGGAWSRLVRVYSRKSNEWTYIYYSNPDKDVRFLVVTLQPHEAVVAQVKFDPVKLVEFVSNPHVFGVALAHDINKGPGGGPGGAPDKASGSGAGTSIARAQADGSGSVGDAAGQGGGDSTEASAVPTSHTPPVLLRNSERPAESSDGAPKVEPVAGVAAPLEKCKDCLKLESRLVSLNVKATDQAGKVVTGLRKEDFAVYENGTKQNIAFFESNTSPVSLILLLDLSGSTHDKVKVIKEAAKKFVDALEPSDRVAVATFTRRVHIVSDFTSDRKLLHNQINKIKNRAGGTAFYDAMWAAQDMLVALNGRRKAIVVLTDGVDNCLEDPDEYPAKHPYPDLVDRLSEGETAVYPIYLETEPVSAIRRQGKKHQAYEMARARLAEMADMTAGTLYRASEEKDIEGAYRQVAAELHTVYTLAYNTGEAGDRSGNPAGKGDKRAWRKISVTVNQQGAIARTRRGFYSD